MKKRDSTISFRLPKELRTNLELLAKEDSRKLSDMVCLILKEAVLKKMKLNKSL